MIRASPVVVVFSVALATVHPALCTWAGGGSTLSQVRHSLVKRHFYSGYQCPGCNKELINPVFICGSNHILCEHCASRCQKRHQHCCSLCGKTLLESFTALTAKNARYLEALNRKQSKPRHCSPQRRSHRHFHVNIHTLSYRANQLSKRQRDMGQLARLARSLPDSRELGNATAIDLALLFNSVSKLIPLRNHKHTGKKCIGRLSQEIVRRDLSGWWEQSLAMTASGLSKMEGEDITEALKKIAQEVNRRGVKGGEEQHLAMLANGLSKAGGDVITEALKVIAQEVIRSKVRRCTEQQLAMLVGGLSKAEGDVIAEALEVIAQQVIQSRVRGWKEQHLAMLANGLSKAGGDVITEALKVMAQEVILRKVKGWKEQHLVMLASGLSKVESKEITEALKKIAKVVRRGKKVWIEQQLAMLATGLSKAEGDVITKALKRIAQEANRIGVKGWKEQHLVMLASGLSKAEGGEITEALKKIAKVVRRGQKVWTEQHLEHLAMLATGLSKAEGREIIKALKEIAQEANRVGVEGWKEKHLAMLASGLSKAEGWDITEALKKIAKVVRRGKKIWTEQDLAMLASGLSKAEGRDITAALKKIAKAVRRGQNVWAEQHLAMLASGLSKVEGEEITEALQKIAQETARRDVKRWTEQDLAMMISGLGTIADHPAFSSCVRELISRQNSRWLLMALVHLCRLQLSEDQVQAGLDIVVALDQQDFKPEDRHQSKDILWCLSLLHFVSDKHKDEVSCQAVQQLRGLYQKFAGYCGHYPAGCGSFDQKPIGDLWQECYARDYWKSGESLPVPPVTYPIDGLSISLTQRIISGVIEREISRARVREEVCINGFPVDMVVGEKVCVEIDGPCHYVYSDQPGLYDSATGKENPVAAPLVQKYQRAKDHFVVHMLEKYGYTVFRIPYDVSTNSRQLQRVIQDIQESLNQAD